MGQTQQKWIARLLIVLLVLFILYMLSRLSFLAEPFLLVGKALLLPVGIAALLSYFLHPLVEKLHQNGMERRWAVSLIFLAVIGLISFVLIIGLPFLIAQIQHAFAQLPGKINELTVLVNRLQDQLNSLPEPFQSQSKEWTVQLEAWSGKALDQVEKVAVFLLHSVFAFIVIPFLVFYFLKDYDLVEKTAWYVTPRKWRQPLHRYLKDLDQTFGSFIRGQLLVSLSVAVLSVIGLWLLGVPYPILLGLFIGAADLIPYFGAFIGAAPAIIVALLESWQLAIFTAILLIVIQQVEGNVLSPFIVGKTLHLHPMLIIIALLVGIQTGGVIGLLVAVPMLAVAKVTLWHFRLHLMND